MRCQRGDQGDVRLESHEQKKLEEPTVEPKKAHRRYSSIRPSVRASLVNGTPQYIMVITRLGGTLCVNRTRRKSCP